VPSPFDARKIARVDLTPGRVHALVLWTRDPSPMLGHLAELASLGHRFVFQFTLVEYPAAMHPGMKPLHTRLEAFRRLSEAIGPERVLWRYDPVVLTAQTDTDFHLRSFEGLARSLEGFTRRVTVSLMEPYRKTRGRMARIGAHLLAPGEQALASMFTSMAAMARSRGMEPLSCADEAGLAALGFSPGACVDTPFLNQLFSLSLPEARDANQRPACRCAKSTDIGMYDACPAGCAYCYATQDFSRARRALSRHDPDSPSLLGHFTPPHPQLPLIAP